MVQINNGFKLFFCIKGSKVKIDNLEYWYKNIYKDNTSLHECFHFKDAKVFKCHKKDSCNDGVFQNIRERIEEMHISMWIWILCLSSFLVENLNLKNIFRKII